MFHPKGQRSKLVSQLRNISFFILCDGSHHRWKNEDEYMKVKMAYIRYLVESDIQFVEMAT
nr:hypothetical protein [Bacillus cereus]